MPKKITEVHYIKNVMATKLHSDALSLFDRHKSDKNFSKKYLIILESVLMRSVFRPRRQKSVCIMEIILKIFSS